MSEQYHVEDYISSVELQFGDVVQFPVSRRDDVFIEWGAESVIFNVDDSGRGFSAGRVNDRWGPGEIGLATPGTSWTPARKTGERWTLAKMVTALECQHGKPRVRSFEEYYGGGASKEPVVYPQRPITDGLPRN
jgi:hypothetical protein